MPMVTLTKTFDVTRLCSVSRKRGMKFNMLLCWCIGKTASRIEEFYMLPQRIRVGETSAKRLSTNQRGEASPRLTVSRPASETYSDTSYTWHLTH